MKCLHPQKQLEFRGYVWRRYLYEHYWCSKCRKNRLYKLDPRWKDSELVVGCERDRGYVDHIYGEEWKVNSELRMRGLKNLAEYLRDDGGGHVRWAIERIEELERFAALVSAIKLEPSGYCSTRLDEVKQRAKELYVK